MSCNSASAALGGSTYRANTLGQRLGTGPAPCVVKPKTIRRCNSGSELRQPYEAAFLNGWLAVPTDGVGETKDVTSIRITRVSPADAAFVGQAYSVRTRSLEGVLGWADDNISGAVPSVCLRMDTSSGNAFRLLEPTALLVMAPDHVVVVGAGTINDNPDWLPSVANVYLRDEIWTVYVAVGNGSLPTQIADERYLDIQLDPYNCRCWLVCGSGVVNGKRRAVLRRLSVETSTPVPIPNTGITSPLFVVIDVVDSAIADRVTEAVSIAACENDIVTVGVNVYDGDNILLGVCVWPLRPNLNQLLPWSSTGFNNTVTGMIACEYAVTCACVRLLAPSTSSSSLSSCGGSTVLYVVTVAALNTTLGLPSYGVQVSAFSDDTTPQLTFNAAGTVTWWVGEQGSTRPNDACLDFHGRDVLVVGNSFFAETTSDTEPHHDYVVPGLPTRDVRCAAPFVPQPFVMRVTPAGCANVVLNGVTGCAAVHWASGLSFTNLHTAVLLGDTNDSVTRPSQTAGVFSAHLTLFNKSTSASARARITNCLVTGCGRGDTTTTAVSLQARGCGIVVLEPQCGNCKNCGSCAGSCGGCDVDGCSCSCTASAEPSTTTLILPGAVVLGTVNDVETALPLPGTLAFDSLTQTFRGYIGGAWVTLAIVPPPTAL